MWRHWLLLLGLLVAVLATGAACGGANAGGAEYGVGERSPSELSYPDAPPAPATLAVGDWGKGGVVPTRAGSAEIAVHTDPGDLPRLELAGKTGQKLPLEHTHVSAKLTGFVAEVEVTQTYRNT